MTKSLATITTDNTIIITSPGGDKQYFRCLAIDVEVKRDDVIGGKHPHAVDLSELISAWLTEKGL